MQAYKDKIQDFSSRIVEAQRPIRVLDAIKWDPSVEAAFFAKKARALPAVDEAFYRNIPLGFDPAAKISELEILASEATCR